jgi:hypothetical protein
VDACVRCKAGIPDGSQTCPYCEAPQAGKLSKSVGFYTALFIIVMLISVAIRSFLLSQS